MHNPNRTLSPETIDSPETNEDPAAVACEIIGARELPENVAAQLRDCLLPSLLGLVTALPGSSVAVAYASEPGQPVRIRLTSRARTGAEADDLGAAVQDLLSAGLDTVQMPQLPQGNISQDAVFRGPMWALVPLRTSGPLGYGVSSPALPWPLVVEGFSRASATELLKAMARTPGTGLTVTFGPCVPPAGDRPGTVEVSVRVSAAGGFVPVDVRAVAGRLIPSHVLQESTAPVRLVLAHADAAALDIIPVAGRHPLPGLPTGYAAAVPIRHLPGKSQPADGLMIGTYTAPDGAPVRASLTDAERIRHLHVTGRTGTGKSTLLARIAHSVALKGEGMLVLDPHGTLVDRIAAELPASARARTLLIRSGDLAYPVPVNPLATTDPVTCDIAVADILAGFQTMFDPGNTGIVGPRFHHVVGAALRTLIAAHGPAASILNVPRLLTDTGYQRRCRASVTDPDLAGFWNNNDKAARSNEYGDMISWIISKWERFSGTAALRAILGTGRNHLDLRHGMDTNQIILIDLSKAVLGAPAAELLGHLHTTNTWTAALNRIDPSTIFTVLIDEAQSFLTGATATMLSEGRKYGLSLVLAHQYLGQLKPELGAAMAGNTATHIAFRAGRADAEVLAARLGTVPPETYTTLPDFSAVTQRSAGPTTTHPATLTVAHLAPAGEPGHLIRHLEEQSRLALAQTDPQTPVPLRGTGTQAGPDTDFLTAWLARREAAARTSPASPVPQPPAPGTRPRPASAPPAGVSGVRDAAGCGGFDDM
jgi:hypothetical protein